MSKVTKSDIEACHRIVYSREMIVRFVSRIHSFDVLKMKKNDSVA